MEPSCSRFYRPSKAAFTASNRPSVGVPVRAAASGGAPTKTQAEL